MEDTNWTFKYRPKNLDDLYENKYIKNVINQCIDTNDMPNFLFYGTSGTGKTSTIYTIINHFFNSKNKNLDNRILYLNASDDRGINVVREKIKTFSKLSINKNEENSPNFKIIILDEADNMTQDAQSALRRIMEIYSNNTRFCIICNYLNKIIEPIVSRCSSLRFISLNKECIYNIINRIEVNEKFKLDKDIKDYLYNETHGDARKIINLLECLYNLYYKNNKNNDNHIYKYELLNDLTGNMNNKTFLDLLYKIKNSKIQGLPELISNIKYESYDINKIIKKVIQFVYNSNLNYEQQYHFVKKYNNYLRNIFEGCNEEIVLNKLFYDIKLLCNNQDLDLDLDKDT